MRLSEIANKEIIDFEKGERLAYLGKPMCFSMNKQEKFTPLSYLSQSGINLIVKIKM